MAQFSRKDRLAANLQRLTADFLNAEYKNTALVTVINLILSQDLKKATIFISIFPEGIEDNIMKKLKKSERNIKEYFKSHTKIKFIPSMEFTLDKGEKNRQRIEEILKSADVPRD